MRCILCGIITQHRLLFKDIYPDREYLVLSDPTHSVRAQRNICKSINKVDVHSKYCIFEFPPLPRMQSKIGGNMVRMHFIHRDVQNETLL